MIALLRKLLILRKGIGIRKSLISDMYMYWHLNVVQYRMVMASKSCGKVQASETRSFRKVPALRTCLFQSGNRLERRSFQRGVIIRKVSVLERTASERRSF